MKDNDNQEYKTDILGYFTLEELAKICDYTLTEYLRKLCDTKKIVAYKAVHYG